MSAYMISTGANPDILLQKVSTGVKTFIRVQSVYPAIVTEKLQNLLMSPPSQFVVVFLFDCLILGLSSIPIEPKF
jgi:hypothetical protein